MSYRSISTGERGSSARTCEKLSQLSSLLSRTAHARLLATSLNIELVRRQETNLREDFYEKYNCPKFLLHVATISR